MTASSLAEGADYVFQSSETLVDFDGFLQLFDVRVGLVDALAARQVDEGDFSHRLLVGRFVKCMHDESEHKVRPRRRVIHRSLRRLPLLHAERVNLSCLFNRLYLQRRHIQNAYHTCVRVFSKIKLRSRPVGFFLGEEQVLQLVEVQLDHVALEAYDELLRLLEAALDPKKLIQRSRNNAWLVRVALNRVRLAGPGLSIRKDTHVEPINCALHQHFRVLEDFFLSRTLAETAVELVLFFLISLALNAFFFQLDLQSVLVKDGNNR